MNSSVHSASLSPKRVSTITTSSSVPTCTVCNLLKVRVSRLLTESYVCVPNGYPRLVLLLCRAFFLFFEFKESSGDLGIRGSNEIRLQSKLFDCDVHTKKNNRDSPVPSSLSIYALSGSFTRKRSSELNLTAACYSIKKLIREFSIAGRCSCCLCLFCAGKITRSS